MVALWLMGAVALAGCVSTSEPGGTTGTAGQAGAGAGAGGEYGYSGTAGVAGTAAGGAAGATAGAGGVASAGAGGAAGGDAGTSGNSGQTSSVLPVSLSPEDQQACERPMRAVLAGSEVGALQVEQGQARLQRYGLDGQPLGAPLALGEAPTSDGGAPNTVSLATDGTTYVACWSVPTALPSADESGHIVCVTIPVGGGAITPTLSVPGSHPSVTWRSEGFAMAWRTHDKIGVRYLEEANPVGPVTLPLTGQDDPVHGPSGVLLTATESGFALATLAHPTLYRLSPSLATMSQLPLGDGFYYRWENSHLVALGDVVALSERVPYEGRITIVDGAAKTRTVSVQGGGKAGMNLGVAVQGEKMVVVWPANGQSKLELHLDSFDPLTPSALHLGEDYVPTWGDGCSFAAVSVPGATLSLLPISQGLKVVSFASP